MVNEIKSSTVRINDYGSLNIYYYDWFILRGPQHIVSKNTLTYYNDAQLTLGIL